MHTGNTVNRREYLTRAKTIKTALGFTANSCLPKIKEAKDFILFYFIPYFLFSIFIYRPPRSGSLLLPADPQPLRSRVGFYHLVAGLLNPRALLMKAKFSNLPVPIGQDLRNSQFSYPT